MSALDTLESQPLVYLHFRCPAACPLDVFVCADGTELKRDPLQNCQFPR
jgi:hypothetical protein